MNAFLRGHKLALIALILAISGIWLAGWGEIDIRNMREAHAENMEKLLGAIVHVRGIVSEQGTHLESLGEKLSILKEDVYQNEVLNELQEYDLCRLRHEHILPQGFLGVELAADLPQRRGILITKVHRNCPAEAVGLEQGDIIVRYNGAEAWSTEVLICDIRATRPFNPIEIDILRGDQRKRFVVILMAK